MNDLIQNDFKQGFHDGIPIALGYLVISMTIGMMAIAKGLPVWSAILISLTNLTSAGEVAGIGIIAAQGSYFEMALTQFFVNLRYALMSIAWTQKIEPKTGIPHRMLMAIGNTDEIFAVSATQPGMIGVKYVLGLTVLPFLGWSAGTALGALFSNSMPAFFISAFSVAVYGMFLAIIIPKARADRRFLIVTAVAVVMSCCFYYIPVLKTVGSGFVIIICSMAASALGAYFFPIVEEASEETL